MAMAHALRQARRPAQVHLVDSGTALATLRAPAASRLRAALEAQGVTLVEDAPIARVTAEGLELVDGRGIEADFVTGAAGARPHGWMTRTGLDLHDGFIRVAPTLQSSAENVFACGDCAHMADTPRPKAGVYAVRQAPVLLDNLRARLAGTNDLRSYKPQRDYLKLISLGERSALGNRFGLALSGPLMWRWKDRIDRRFMDRFHELPAMATPALPVPRAAGAEEALGGKPMCGGCGAKVGSGALAAALDRLPPSARDDITALPGDDAALLTVGGQRQVMTTDHLRAFVEDPWVMARIAAVHALGDIWAMGAAPQAATANLVLPRMSEALAERTLTEILDAASGIFRETGAEIVGGHSSMGAEMTIGFTITGLCERDPITLAGGRPGDALILTKPLGTGVLMAAEMAGQAEGAWIAAAMDRMTAPQTDAARALRDAHAMTDVTGFGLAGHLANICAASGTGAEIDLAGVPLLEGAATLSARGVRSTLYPRNREALPGLPEGPRADLLFDPQTAGGLLAAVPDGPAALAALHAAGVTAACIGRLTSRPGQISVV
ncbi:NADH dehydrogenase-like protein / Selenide,water dikinase [Salipiger mucosus DSM 16094]|uniref:NADH dehydrogenase-like protein / Selenide,water dikinase n=1 Tax=Salipiger mucosus DSM 16094 TaxID=1123237 RepID=S9R090_9RHOB|nr:NADH dehydrogenase-like protein / Selenide,water dikinase [Salipiger mucosus DSM 16094]